MQFWKTYFAVVDVLKSRVALYEEMMDSFNDNFHRLEREAAEERLARTVAEQSMEEHKLAAQKSLEWQVEGTPEEISVNVVPSAFSESSADSMLAQDLQEWVPEKAEIEKPAARSKSLSGKIALVVNPAEKNRVLISRYLTTLKMNFDFVKNQSETDSRKSEKHFDVVIDTTGMNFPIDKSRFLQQVQESL